MLAIRAQAQKQSGDRHARDAAVCQRCSWTPLAASAGLSWAKYALLWTRWHSLQCLCSSVHSLQWYSGSLSASVQAPHSLRARLDSSRVPPEQPCLGESDAQNTAQYFLFFLISDVLENRALMAGQTFMSMSGSSIVASSQSSCPSTFNCKASRLCDTTHCGYQAYSFTTDVPTG
jgi:hypothetical protein